MKKRLFTLCLAILLFAGALTGILVSTSANTETEFDPDSYDYEALYVDGAVIHYSAMDRHAGDTVDSVLATAKDGQQLLLEAIDKNVPTEWTYGDGYLEISTGSVIQAKDLFAPGDAEDSEKEYTVEYLYGTVDKGLPQTLTDYKTDYPKNTLYGSASLTSHKIASSSFVTHYVKDDALAHLKKLADDYHACADSTALQATFEFKPNEEHVGSDSDGVFDYNQTKELISAQSAYYSFFNIDYTRFGASRVGKTVYNLGGTWKADYDWKNAAQEVFRMKFGETRKLNFTIKNTLDESGTYTETTDIYANHVLLHTWSHTFASEKLGCDLVLAKDIGARIYAIRVYDRVLSTDEMQQNHIADIFQVYRLDPSFYTEADEWDKNIYKNALLSVNVGVDSKEDVLETIRQAQASVLKTERNEYTSLYVQDNLLLMLAPMTTTRDDIAEGDLITTLTDLNGNFYAVGSSSNPASFTDRAVNLGLMQSLNFGNILPEDGSYTVRLIYANHLSPVYTESKSQMTKFIIGPANYRIGYAPPTVDPSAKSGVTRSFLYMTDGTTGKLSWKNDFDTVWASGAKQPDLLAIDYGQIHDFTNEFAVGASTITVDIYSDNRKVTTTSTKSGEFSTNALTLGAATNLDIYAVMVYDCILTDEQKMQNHFADLMSYYQVDMAMFDRITNDNTKVRLYEALADVKIGETSKDYLQSVLESFALTGGALGVIKADDYMTFEGIQARIEDYASVRALFSFNNEKIAELEKIGADVELGAILMPVTEDNAMEELTVAYVPSLGEYAPTSDGAIQKTVYRKGEVFDGLYGFATDEKRYFSATVPSLAPTADDTALNQQYYMRAYMAVDFDGSNFVLYSDAKSDLFGDSVSVMEACDYFLFTGYAESEILAALAGEYAAAAAKKTLEVSLLAHGKYDIAEMASALIQSARDGAQEALAQNNLASSGISIEMSQSEAMRVGPQAATTKVQAELYATIGIAKYEEALGAIEEARVAAQQMAADVYQAALDAGADEATAAAVRETACARLLALIGDVEAYLQTAEPLVADMQAVLSAFADYKALLQLSKVFPSKASVFINKLPITRYTIVTDSEHLAIAEDLQKLLLAHIGNTVGVYNVDNKYVGSRYDYTALNAIILGMTDKHIDADGSSYAIYGDGNCIYLEGSTLEAVEAASAKFFKGYCDDTGRLQITLDSGANALLNQAYTPLISFNYGQSYSAVACDSYDAEGVWQVFLQKMQALPEEITVIDTVEIEDIPDSMGHTYYVATTGDDANAGTLDAPFATLEAALAKASYVGGATIYLRGGYYELSKPITVDSRHNGTAVTPLYISAYPGEEVIFTSAKQIAASSLQTIDDAIANNLIDAKMKTRLNVFSEDNSQNVYVTYLDPAKYPYGTVQETQLYINGALSHVARYPNKGAEDVANGITNGRIAFTDRGLPGGLDKGEEDVLKVGKVASSTSKLYDQHKDDVGGWEIVFDNCLYKDHLLSYDEDVELYTYAAVYQEWERDHYSLTLSVDDQGSNIMTSAESSEWGCQEYPGNNMYFYNAIEDLDQNGEFYLDHATGMLYIYSDTSLSDAEILLSSTETALLDVAGASNVVVNGLTFTKTMATALTVRDCSHVIVQNCTFNDIKGNGAAIDGRYCGLLKCDFSNTTSAMVTVSSQIEVLQCSYNFVQNCYFHDPNELVQAALRLGGIGGVASHNLFSDTVVNYNYAFEMILEYNEFNRGSQITYDSGPVYLSGSAKKRGNFIRYNYFHDLNVSKYGIYLDDLSSGNYVYGNIIHYAEENSGGGKCVNIHGGNMNVVYNNIGFNAETSGILSNINYYVSSINGLKTGGGGMSYRWEAMSNKWLNSGAESEEIAARFPLYVWFAELVKQHIDERSLNPAWADTSDKNSTSDALEIFLRSPSFNICLDNVMVNCGNQGYSLADPLKNGKEDRNLYFETPEEVGFVDYEGYDFNLRSDSAVWSQNPQFFEIPFDRMGRIADIQEKQ